MILFAEMNIQYPDDALYVADGSKNVQSFISKKSGDDSRHQALLVSEFNRISKTIEELCKASAEQQSLRMMYEATGTKLDANTLEIIRAKAHSDIITARNTKTAGYITWLDFTAKADLPLISTVKPKPVHPTKYDIDYNTVVDASLLQTQPIDVLSNNAECNDITIGNNQDTVAVDDAMQAQNIDNSAAPTGHQKAENKAKNNHVQRVAGHADEIAKVSVWFLSLLGIKIVMTP